MKTKRQALVLGSSLLAVTVLAWMGLLWKGERQVYGMSNAAQGQVYGMSNSAQGQASGVERTTTPSPAATLRPTASLTTWPTSAEVFVPYQDYLNETPHAPGWIIFAKDEDVNDRIRAKYFIMDADGNHIWFLHKGYGVDAVSHSGDKVAHVSGVSNPLVRLYDARSFLETRKWRPPAESLETIRYLPGAYRLEKTDVYPTPLSLAWSPDDQMLAVSMVERHPKFSEDWGHTNISSRVCLIQLKSKWEAQCWEEAGKYVYRLSWAPDGKELLMSYEILKEERAVVARIDLNGKELELLEGAYSGVWSPVEYAYVYYQLLGKSTGIYLRDFHKKNERRLFDSRGPAAIGNQFYTNLPCYFAWSPDGRYLVFNSAQRGETRPITNDISRMDMQTGEIMRISQAFTEEWLFFPEWGE